MQLEMITEGLLTLLSENNYNPRTIHFYEKEWQKIHTFLIDNYGDSMFDMERGISFLEKQYGFVTDFNDGTLTQQRIQLLRVIHMLEDYRLHKVLTRRYYASKNPIQLNDYYRSIQENYVAYMDTTELSQTTKDHYKKSTSVFLDYLTQKKLFTIDMLTMENCNDYLKTLGGYSFKTVEQNVCGLRHFLRYLFSEKMILQCYSDKIHMPAISKNAGVPSAWNQEELKKLLDVIDRNSPIGKRDYAMILLASVLGLRSIDIKFLTFGNFDWESKKLSIIQHKTHKPLTLPIPDVVGWAIIDYIKNGRPKYYETDRVFVKHMPPFDPIGDNNHMQQIIVRYMNKAGIKRTGRQRAGFHSLRHSAASMLLEMETPLPTITEILGHSDPDITAIYLKTDLKKLAECVLEPEGFLYE